MSKTRHKIFIVDDVMFHLLSTKERLKKKYEVFPIQNTEELFATLEKKMPDLIVMDINMPKCDGYETLTMLKDDFRYAHIPVVFLTSQNDKVSLTKAMNLGAADFLTKPYTDAELIDCIEYQLNPVGIASMKPVILAVDDNPSLLRSINALLHDKHTVYTLPDPEKMKGLLTMIHPDLFILDCNMPVLSGFDLVPIIRSFPTHENTPVIFLTAETTIDNISVAMHLGACDFLAKPIDEFKLREKVSFYLKDFIIQRRIRDLT